MKFKILVVFGCLIFMVTDVQGSRFETESSRANFEVKDISRGSDVPSRDTTNVQMKSEISSRQAEVKPVTFSGTVIQFFGKIGRNVQAVMLSFVRMPSKVMTQMKTYLAKRRAKSINQVAIAKVQVAVDRLDSVRIDPNASYDVINSAASEVAVSMMSLDLSTVQDMLAITDGNGEAVLASSSPLSGRDVTVLQPRIDQSGLLLGSEQKVIDTTVDNLLDFSDEQPLDIPAPVDNGLTAKQQQQLTEFQAILKAQGITAPGGKYMGVKMGYFGAKGGTPEWLTPELVFSPDASATAKPVSSILSDFDGLVSVPEVKAPEIVPAQEKIPLSKQVLKVSDLHTMDTSSIADLIGQTITSKLPVEAPLVHDNAMPSPIGSHDTFVARQNKLQSSATSVSRLIADNQSLFETSVSSNAAIFFSKSSEFDQIMHDQSLSAVEKSAQLDEIGKSIQEIVAVEKVYEGLTGADALLVDLSKAAVQRGTTIPFKKSTIKSQHDFDVAYDLWQQGKATPELIRFIGGDKGDLIYKAFVQKDEATMGSFSSAKVAKSSITDVIAQNQHRFKNDDALHSQFDQQVSLFKSVSADGKLSPAEKIEKYQQIQKAMNGLSEQLAVIADRASIDQNITTLLVDSQKKFATNQDFMDELKIQQMNYEAVLRSKLTGDVRMQNLQEIQNAITGLVELVTAKGALPVSIKTLINENGKMISGDPDFVESLNMQLQDLMTEGQLGKTLAVRVNQYKVIQDSIHQFVKLTKAKHDVKTLIDTNTDSLQADTDFASQFTSLLSRYQAIESAPLMRSGLLDVGLVDDFTSLQTSIQQLVVLKSTKAKLATLQANGDWRKNVYEQLPVDGHITSQSVISQTEFDRLYNQWKVAKTNTKLQKSVEDSMRRSSIPNLLDVFTLRQADENSQAQSIVSLRPLVDQQLTQLELDLAATSFAPQAQQLRSDFMQINSSTDSASVKLAKLQKIETSITSLAKQSKLPASSSAVITGGTVAPVLRKVVIPTRLDGSKPDAALQDRQASVVGQLGSGARLRSVEKATAAGKTDSTKVVVASSINKEWYAAGYEGLPDVAEAAVLTSKIINSKQDFRTVYDQWNALQDQLVQEKNPDVQQALSLQLHLLNMQAEASLHGSTIAFELIRKSSDVHMWKGDVLNQDVLNSLIDLSKAERKTSSSSSSGGFKRKSIPYQTLEKTGQGNSWADRSTNLQWIDDFVINGAKVHEKAGSRTNRQLVDDDITNMNMIVNNGSLYAGGNLPSAKISWIQSLFKLNTTELEDLDAAWTSDLAATDNPHQLDVAQLHKVIDYIKSVQAKMQQKQSQGPKKLVIPSRSKAKSVPVQTAEVPVVETTPLAEIVTRLAPIDGAVLAKSSPLLGGKAQLLSITPESAQIMSKADKARLTTVYDIWIEGVPENMKNETNPAYVAVMKSKQNLEVGLYV